LIYAQIPPFREIMRLTDPAVYYELPDDWHVVVVDVRGSTDAIKAGRYKDVNAVGAACIVAVLNAIGQADVPFMFGGDGATLAVPPEVVTSLRAPLHAVRRLSEDVFELSVRTGVVPVSVMVERGHTFSVARYAPNEHVGLAMLGGSGWSGAEEAVKGEEGGRWAVPDAPPEAVAAVRFDGFECRWRPLRSRHGQMVSLLVKTRGPFFERGPELIEQIDGLTGGLVAHAPASSENLVLASRAREFSVEAQVRSGQRRGWAFLRARTQARLQAAVGGAMMSRRLNLGGFDAGRYVDALVEQPDCFKYDGVLRAVLDLDTASIERLLSYLDQEEEAGSLVYGIWRSSAALMTCMVFDQSGQHVHFVDGADGGYALAAKMIKPKLQGLEIF